MKSSSLKAAVVACAALMGTVFSPAAGLPATLTGMPSAPTQIVLTVNGSDAGITAQQLTCNVWIDNPHYSLGAPGVVAKVRYVCTGNMVGTLGVHANLYKYAPGTYGPYVPKASNWENRPVGPGSESTVYVPAQSMPGIACNLAHWYYANAFLTLTTGPSSNSASVTSNTVHPPTCS